MSDYIQTCAICGKKFDLYNGEGWGESYFSDEKAMLPKSRYVCMKCIHKRKEQEQKNKSTGHVKDL